MNAARYGWKNPWALAALILVGWAAGWLVTWGHWGWFAWEPQGSLYDWQAKVLWEDGRWDVPEKVTHIETFLVGGKAIMYFGPGPALLRFVTYLFGPAEPGTWSRPLVALSVLATLFVVLSLVQWISRVRLQEGTMPRLRPGWVGALLLLLGFAVDAELGHGARLHALHPDLLAAAHAFAEYAALDLVEGLADLRNQGALALAEP